MLAGASVSVTVASAIDRAGWPVEKLRSAPSEVPAALEATRRKWYVAPAVRPESADDTLCVDVPEPALAFAVDVPYAAVAPYSKWYVVALPFGLTVPLSVATVEVTDDAGSVVTVGFVSSSAIVTTEVAAPSDALAGVESVTVKVSSPSSRSSPSTPAENVSDTSPGGNVTAPLPAV